MNPREIKRVLAEIGGGPNKRLGQNFLIDPHVLESIVEAATPAIAGKTLEVGPGLGVLTRALLKAGHDVVALERDRRFVAYLEKDILDEKFRLVQGDAADLDWENIIDEPWSLVSNLPYSISSLALRKALWGAIPASHVVVLVQREVAERAIAKDGKTSLLSLMVSLASESSRIVRRVPAGAFFPPPKVESAVLEIVPKTWAEREAAWGMHPEAVMRVAKAGFASPRKKLISNLASHLAIDKAELQKAFQAVKLGENARAEELSPSMWARLAAELSPKTVQRGPLTGF